MEAGKQRMFLTVLEEHEKQVRVLQSRARNEMIGDGIFQESIMDYGEKAEFNDRLGVNAALCEFLGRMLKKVCRARRRIEEGTFGTCLSCGQDISEKRLVALPFEDRCLECQEKEERLLIQERAVSSKSKRVVVDEVDELEDFSEGFPLQRVRYKAD